MRKCEKSENSSRSHVECFIQKGDLIRFVRGDVNHPKWMREVYGVVSDHPRHGRRAGMFDIFVVLIVEDEKSLLIEGRFIGAKLIIDARSVVSIVQRGFVARAAVLEKRTLKKK